MIRGTDVRNARAGQDDMRKWDTSVHAQPGCRQTFRQVHGGQYRKPSGGGAGQPDPQRGVIKSRIEDSGQIENIGSEQEASDLALVLRAGALPASIQISI